MTEPRWRRVDHVVSTQVDDGVALLDLDRGVYFVFNVTAAAIWSQLEAPLSEAAIVDSLTSEFDVAPEHCAKSVSAVLARFTSESLIQRVD